MEKILKRVCRVCGSTENEFKKHSGNTRVGICKPCHRAYCKCYVKKVKVLDEKNKESYEDQPAS